MAGTSESRLLGALGRQIDEFPGDSPYANKGRELPTTESTLRLHQETEKELKQLEHDVKELERQHKIRTLDKHQKLKLLNDKEKMVSSENIDPGDVEDDINRLRKELQLTAELTGLDITGTECTVTDVGDNFIERSYQVDGSSRGVEFQMVFNVKETWNSQKKDDESTSLIEKLRVAFSEEESEVVLRPLVKELESEASVTSLLHVIVAFGEWRQQRNDAISQVCEMFPNEAKRGSTVNELIVRPASIGGCELLFEWSLSFTEDNKSSSSIELTVTTSEETDERDENNLLRRAPSMFNKMQNTLGSGRALEAILKTLCTFRT